MHFLFIELKILNTVRVINVDPCRIYKFDTFIQSQDKVI